LPSQNVAESQITEPVQPPPLKGLLTTRIIGLLDLLRRSGTLANRREFGLSGIEWRIMAQVGDHAPLSLNDLAELLSLDRGQLSRAVKAMVARGLLDSKRRPGGPAIVITLSEEGRALYARMIDLTIARNQFLVGDIPEEDIENVTGILNAVMVKAQLLLERERAASGQQSSDID
jgi:DNA-binding MarR family transcriptional regulator